MQRAALHAPEKIAPWPIDFFYVQCIKMLIKNAAATRNKIEPVLFCCMLQQQFFMLHGRIFKDCTV
jgi:hypothetical protein